MEYTPDGKYLVMNSNSDLFVYDITKGQPHREPIDRGQPIDALAFSADSKVFALTTYGGPRIFNTKR
jgi:WD40 repeat protein